LSSIAIELCSAPTGVVVPKSALAKVIQATKLARRRT
jgi:hypothetical protein